MCVCLCVTTCKRKLDDNLWELGSRLPTMWIQRAHSGYQAPRAMLLPAELPCWPMLSYEVLYDMSAIRPKGLNKRQFCPLGTAGHQNWEHATGI